MNLAQFILTALGVNYSLHDSGKVRTGGKHNKTGPGRQSFRLSNRPEVERVRAHVQANYTQRPTDKVVIRDGVVKVVNTKSKRVKLKAPLSAFV